MKRILLALTIALAACQPAFAVTKTPAKDITVNAAAFNGNLTTADTDVQTALATVNGLNISGTATTGWTKTGTNVNLTVTSDAVNIGSVSPGASGKLSVGTTNSFIVTDTGATTLAGLTNNGGYLQGGSALNVFLGNLGIGTTGPPVALSVGSTSQAQINSSGQATLVGILNSGGYTQSGASANTLTGALTSAGITNVGTIAQTGKLTVSSGNVGIGSLLPTQALDVVGTIKASIDVKIGSQSVCQANGTNCPGGITGFANPTASVGLAAVNGSAVTAMRSDAAAALSQDITPTWTGKHIFHGSPDSIITSGNVGVGTTVAQVSLHNNGDFISKGPVVDVRSYGAVCNGTTDDTAAFNTAIAAMPKGGTLLVACDKAAVNLTITQPSLTIRGLGWYGASTTTNRTVLVPYATGSPVIQIGNDTALVRGVSVENIAINGGGPNGQGTIGLYLAGGAYRDSFRNIWIQNFSTNNVKMLAGTSYPVAYIFFNSFVFESSVANTAVVGAYYPTSGSQYTTAIYLENGSITSANAGGYALEVDSADVHVTDTYLQCPNNGGIHLVKSASPTPSITAGNMTVDSDSSTDNLVTGYNTDKVISDFIKGTFSVDGYLKTSDASQILVTGSGNLGYQSQISYPTIVGEADFVPTSNPAANSNIHIASGGNDLTMTSSSGYFFDNVAGTHFMRLDLPSGNLGIGTTSGERLAVGVGNIQLDNAYSLKARDNAGTSEGLVGITSANNVQLNAPTLSGSIQYIIRNATGAHQWLTGGVNMMQLTFGGNLGIATTSPGSRLSVNGGASFGSYATTASPIGGIIVSGNVGVGSSAPGTALDVTGVVRASSDIKVASQSVCQANGTNCPGGITGFANPSASVSTSAVNGSAVTAMRSDAAPAIDQTMVPTWTGLHTFNKSGISLVTAANIGIGSQSPGSALDVFGSQRILNSGNLYVTGNIGINNSSPSYPLQINGHGVYGSAVVAANLENTTTTTSGNNSAVEADIYPRAASTTSGTYFGLLGVSDITLSSNVNYTANPAIVGLAGQNASAGAGTVTGAAAFDALTGANTGGGTITNQYGLYVNDQTVGTNNYGVWTGISSGTNKWNIYANGSANNYFAGNTIHGSNSAPLNILDVNGSVAIGSSYAATKTVASNSLAVAGNIGIGTWAPTMPLVVSGIGNSQSAPVGMTASVNMSGSSGNNSLAEFDGSARAGGATSNAYHGLITVENAGDAFNYTGTTGIIGHSSFAGNTSSATVTGAAAFAAGNGQNSGGGTVTNQYGYYANNLTSGTSNYGFFGAVTSGGNKWNTYMNGTALNYFNANVGIGSTQPAYALDISNGDVNTNAVHYKSNTSALITNDAVSAIYGTSSGGSVYPFLEAGNMVIQPRSSTTRDIVFATGSTTPTLRAVIDRNGNIGLGTWLPNGRLTVIGGNAGIGTLSPGAQLDVAGNMRISTGGFFVSQQATAPTVASNDCGTITQGTVVVNSSDLLGKITAGTTAVTSCAITFNGTHATAPICFCQDQANILAVKCTTSTTKLTVTTLSAMDTDTISYWCPTNIP